MKNKIKEFYGEPTITEEYLSKRFTSVSGIKLHEREINTINDFFAIINPEKIIDLATGPARISKDIKNFKKGWGIDSSERMVKMAKNILQEEKWSILKGDAFNIPFPTDFFDCVVSFRFIFHFDDNNRKRIFNEIWRVLKLGGYLIFEARNWVVNNPDRVKNREAIQKEWGLDPMDAKYWKKDELISELSKVGFKIINLEGVFNHSRLQSISFRLMKLKMDKLGDMLFNLLEKFKSDQPWEWVVICQKI